MKVLAVCGSLQAESSNLSLLRAAAALPPAGTEVTIFDGIRDLPHFNPDVAASAAVPEPVQRWQQALAASDAVLIASPEYGHSLPGALKNAIDWVIGSGELEGRCVAVTASTAGYGRGLLGLAALKATLGAVSAKIIGGEPTVRGPRFDEEVAKLVADLVEAAARRKASENT